MVLLSEDTICKQYYTEATSGIYGLSISLFLFYSLPLFLSPPISLFLVLRLRYIFLFSGYAQSENMNLTIQLRYTHIILKNLFLKNAFLRRNLFFLFDHIPNPRICNLV